MTGTWSGLTDVSSALTGLWISSNCWDKIPNCSDELDFIGFKVWMEPEMSYGEGVIVFNSTFLSVGRFWIDPLIGYDEFVDGVSYMVLLDLDDALIDCWALGDWFTGRVSKSLFCPPFDGFK